MTEENIKEVNVPTKFNPATQKYEVDSEALNKKVEEINSEKSVESEVKKDIENVKLTEDPKIVDDKKGSEGGFKLIVFVMLISLVLAGLWDKIPAIKNSVHVILDPSAGALLDWKLSLGMFIIVVIITLITTVVQKYATDQKALKELKAEQKEIQNQMKEFKDHPEKVMHLQKKQFKLMPKQMKLSMRALAYTGIPFILFFRWFGDYFTMAGDPKLWPGVSWFWFYLLGAIIIGVVLRKYMDVV